MSAATTKIIIGSDHAGFELKEHIRAFLEKRGMTVADAGAYSTDSVDYPAVAASVADRILKGEFAKGMLICGTGLGMCYAANRFKGIRAALCESEATARMASAHNNANILCLGGRVLPPEKAEAVTAAWLDTPFEGGRHQRRIDMLDDL